MNATIQSESPRQRWDITDIDVLVVDKPLDAGKSKMLRLDQEKTGIDDPHALAVTQNTNAVPAIQADGGTRVRLELEGKDITAQLELGSIATAGRFMVGQPTRDSTSHSGSPIETSSA